MRCPKDAVDNFVVDGGTEHSRKAAIALNRGDAWPTHPSLAAATFSRSMVLAPGITNGRTASMHLMQRLAGAAHLFNSAAVLIGILP